jgi:EAL domain-containing protein (putative c-di-GMP-specific phosphodiesterase class I)
VAEGIETREHRDVLARLGCPLGQGYLYSKPVTAEECRPWIKRQAAVMAG